MHCAVKNVRSSFQGRKDENNNPNMIKLIYRMDIKFENDVKFIAKEEEIFPNCIWGRIVESVD